jgi:hypothetical protein
MTAFAGEEVLLDCHLECIERLRITEKPGHTDE